MEDRVAEFLEECNVSGDTMVEMDHQLDLLEEDKREGAYYLVDLLTGFAQQEIARLNKVMKDIQNMCLSGFDHEEQLLFIERLTREAINDSNTSEVVHDDGNGVDICYD